jgi:endonuclease G, mitochondrial
MARKSSSDSGGFIFKTGLFAILAGAAFWIFNQFSGKKTPENDENLPKTEIPATKTPTPQPIATASQVPSDILPALPLGTELVEHTYFVLAYAEPHEQATWVAYEIMRDRLNENWAERPNTFRPDPEVDTESATPRDYNSSGYDKGHLCPAADMAFHEAAIDETFFMSNMSPQVRGFNAGVWRELEELTRDWARRFKRLYVITGPILNDPVREKIGFSKVTVPDRFYKVLLAPDQHRAIAFVMPNQVSQLPVMDFACNIDKVEKLTGLDFFPKILKGLDEELEGSFDPSAWPVNQQRFARRVDQWNKQ